MSDPRPEMKAELHHLVELVARINKLVEAELTQTELAVHINGEIPTVLGNRDQLHQVCLNLLRNAIQASSEDSGTVEIHIENVVERIANTQRHRVQVTFVDDGPGIPQSDMSKLFVPFFTTKTSTFSLNCCHQ